MLQLACIRPGFYMRNMTITVVETWLRVSLNLWEANIDHTIKIALATCIRTLAEVAFQSAAVPEVVPLLVACTKMILSVYSLSTS